MHLAYLLTCCFNFRFLLNILCKYQTVLSKQMLELKQRLLHVWHGIEQTIIDNAIDEWRGRLRAYVPAKGRHFEQQYCCDNIQPYDKRRFSFCQKRHDFSIVFFWKLPQIRTSNFRKVVRQQTDGMLGMVLLEIYFSFQQ